VPKKGEKERLVELAARNADLILTQDREKVKREELRTIGAIDQVGQWIGIGGIRRVEAYDISNTSGVESVGSMVVYEDGKPKRSDYRKFKIQSRGQTIMHLWKRCLHVGFPMEYRKVRTCRKKERIFPMEASPVFRI